MSSSPLSPAALRFFSDEIEKNALFKFVGSTAKMAPGAALRGAGAVTKVVGRNPLASAALGATGLTAGALGLAGARGASRGYHQIGEYGSLPNTPSPTVIM